MPVTLQINNCKVPYYSIVVSLKNYKNYILSMMSYFIGKLEKQGSHDFPKPGLEYFSIVLAKKNGCKIKDFRFI